MTVFVAAVLTAVVACGGSAEVREVPFNDPSMSPTIGDGDTIKVATQTFGEAPERGTVVAFDRVTQSQVEVLVKRVIALPGETVEIRSCEFLIDGVPLEFDFNWADDPSPTWCRVQDAETQVVPTDSVFVVGDNLRMSFDSREFGPVAVEDLRGVVEAARGELGDWRQIGLDPASVSTGR